MPMQAPHVRLASTPKFVVAIARPTSGMWHALQMMSRIYSDARFG